MGKIILMNPSKNSWNDGYIIHSGKSENSLNKTTLFSNKNGILPNQKRLNLNFNKFKELLISLNFDIEILDYPNQLLNQENKNYDAVFIRDSGFMFKKNWIEANFAVKERKTESKVISKIIKNKFSKEIITLPNDALIEFGEVTYIKASNGSFYFGGLSRANKKAHNIIKKIINPDHFILLNSKGYHLDTVFSYLLNKNNKLVALIVAKNMFEKNSIEKLKKLKIKLIYVDNKDSCDIDGLGNYAINSLIGKGLIISGSNFTTVNFYKELSKLGIKFYRIDLIDFNNAGGSVHCLTNQFN